MLPILLFLVAGLVFAAMMFFVLHKLNEIHVLVNSRLSDALREVRNLKSLLGLEQSDDDKA